jgi:hypothetical protein
MVGMIPIDPSFLAADLDEGDFSTGQASVVISGGWMDVLQLRVRGLMGRP